MYRAVALCRLAEGKTVTVRPAPGAELIAIAPGPDAERQLEQAISGLQVSNDSVGSRGSGLIGPDGRRYLLPPAPDSPLRIRQEGLIQIYTFRHPDGRIVEYRGDLLPGVGAVWRPLSDISTPANQSL